MHTAAEMMAQLAILCFIWAGAEWRLEYWRPKKEVWTHIKY
jgi:hypothetical protein